MVLEILKKKIKKVTADISENINSESKQAVADYIIPDNETVSHTVKETVLSTVSESKKGN